MHGASADSLRALVASLGAAVEGGADASRIGDDLFGVAGLMRREPSLRRVATDLSLAPEAKSELVRRILGDQLDPVSTDLVAEAAGRRWAATRHLADALEHVGVIAVVRGAEQKGKADELENELFALERLISGNPDLRDALSDPSRSIPDKRRLLRDLLDGRATSATLQLAEQALTGSYRTVVLALESYEKIAADHRERLVATVRAARDLGDQEQRRLQEALASQYSRPVHLNVVVDPSVLGGMLVSIGDDVIDGTVAGRLDDARRQLAG